MERLHENRHNPGEQARASDWRSPLAGSQAVSFRSVNFLG
jgi:hypothetical protein